MAEQERGRRGMSGSGDAKEALTPEEQERARIDRETLVEFQEFMTDGNLVLGTLGFGLRIERSVPTLAFDHKNRTVLINPDFLKEKGFSREEKRYVFSHEIAHFVQLSQDPETYFRTFELAQERSEVFDDSDLQLRVKEAWNRFYNVFLDVHDNAVVDRRSMWAQSMQEDKHPRQTLYERLTSEDLQGSSKTEQFNFAILRRVMMGVDFEVAVDEDVAEIIDNPFRYGGKTFPSIVHFAREHFFDPELPLHVFLSKLERTLMPMFQKLLDKDIESGAFKKPQRVVELTGDDQDGDEMGKIADGITRSRESGSDRAKRSAREAYANEMAKQGLNEGEIVRMQKIIERTQEVFPTLVDLWASFLQVDTVKDIVRQSGYVSGEDIDVDAFVREIPTLFTQPDRARIMERSFTESVYEIEKPKKISLYLVLDLSGSMDATKRQAVQEVSYSLSRSLIQFIRDKRNATDDPAEVAFEFDLHLIGFGDTHEDLFIRLPEEVQTHAVSDEDPVQLEARLARSVLNISKALGGTRDAGALNQVLEDVVEPSTTERLQANDGVAVVIEITDGETVTADESSRLVSQLNQQPNVFARAIQIEGPIYADAPVRDVDHEGPMTIDPSGNFERVWGANGKKLQNLDGLKALMLKILFSALQEKRK